MARHTPAFVRPLIGGLAVGVLCVLALDVPATVTRTCHAMGDQRGAEDRERGLALLRALG
jgi:hypothetical protein